MSFGEFPKISGVYFGLKFYLKDLLKMEVNLCRSKDILMELKEEIFKEKLVIIKEIKVEE